MKAVPATCDLIKESLEHEKEDADELLNVLTAFDPAKAIRHWLAPLTGALAHSLGRRKKTVGASSPPYLSETEHSTLG